MIDEIKQASKQTNQKASRQTRSLCVSSVVCVRELRIIFFRLLISFQLASYFFVSFHITRLYSLSHTHTYVYIHIHICIYSVTRFINIYIYIWTNARNSYNLKRTEVVLLIYL